jgi:hypothetical protein
MLSLHAQLGTAPRKRLNSAVKLGREKKKREKGQ